MKTTFYDVYNYPDGSDKRKDYWRFHLGKHMDFSKLKGKNPLHSENDIIFSLLHCLIASLLDCFIA